MVKAVNELEQDLIQDYKTSRRGGKIFAPLGAALLVGSGIFTTYCTSVMERILSHAETFSQLPTQDQYGFIAVGFAAFGGVLGSFLGIYSASLGTSWVKNANRELSRLESKTTMVHQPPRV